MNESLLILNGIPGLGNERIKALVEYFGGAKNVLTATEAQLIASHILTSKMTQTVHQFSKDTFLKNENTLIRKNHVQVITYLDELYPASLKEIADAPVLLYVKGDPNCLSKPCIGLVGSREATLYGLSVARQFASELAEQGIVVVSGLARGIDTASHRGALMARGLTAAVLGSGLEHVYPSENKGLLEEIAKNGIVVSEFPMQSVPQAFHFPKRNRIISGLSQGIVVIEAAEKSGALITADFALEQGREVFAVPGKIDSISSKGVNGLIKQGAKLVTDVKEIIEELELQLSNKAKETAVNRLPSDLTDEEKLLLEHITEAPIHIDELSDRCKALDRRFSSSLLQLEMKKLVKQLPGKMFVR
jgi:DNA processing protein